MSATSGLKMVEYIQPVDFQLLCTRIFEPSASIRSFEPFLDK